MTECKYCGAKSDNTMNGICVDCMADKLGDIVEISPIAAPELFKVKEPTPIKFIDLRGQSTGWNFALFNIETNRFITIYDKSTWNTFDNLANSVRLEAHTLCVDPGNNIRRYYGLCPDWVKSLSVSPETQNTKI